MSRPTPIRLQPDPRVARCAWRWESESTPGLFHDAALMLGEAAHAECVGDWDGRHVERLVAPTRIGCRNCESLLRWWACDCPDAVYRERECWHVEEARRLWAAERSNAREARP
jgi:hypothetical protein